jgi:ATP-dependent Lhr-like helicase
VKKDGRVIPGFPDQFDYPLRLAKCIGTNDMASVRLGLDRGQKPGDLPFWVRMLEHRQTKGGFGNKQIAGNKFKGLCRAVGMCLVITGHNRDTALIGEPDLGAAKNMACRKQRDCHRAVDKRLAKIEFLERSGASGAISLFHDGDCLRCRQHMIMPGAGMIGMPMCDNRSFDRTSRVDIGVDWLYIELMVQPVHDIQYRDLQARLQSHPLTAWLEGRGWRWFDHQVEAAEHALAGRDVVVFAPTGAGKTLAGFLPSFLDIDARGSSGQLHTLYISPLKALAVDVHRNIAAPIEALDLPVTFETRTGDTPQSRRQRQKRKPPDFLMTTPESLALLLSYEDAGAYFSGLRHIIIDELHAFFDNKRGDLLSLNLARLATLAPRARRIGLSATIDKPKLARDWLCRRGGRIVTVPQAAAPVIDILQTENRIPWSGHMARHALDEVYTQIAGARMSVVFVNTRAQAEFVFQRLWQLNDRNLRIAVHHGSLERELRRKVESRMAAGGLDCVVATSSLDLGLDWADVDLVIQVGAPKGVSRLLQRVGRANHRLNEPSRAILVPTNRFEYLECVAAQTEIAGNRLDGAAFRRGGFDVLAQHVFGVACSGPFDPEALYHEVICAAPYADIGRQEFDEVVAFVSNGGYALAAYPQYNRLAVLKDGSIALREPRMARQYRMNIGTIVESPMMKVKLRNRTLGSIEENFVVNLSPGDTFLFGGQVLTYEGISNAAVMVSKSRGGEAQIPSYGGGRLPLTTNLSLAVRQLIGNRRAWDRLPDQIRDWLALHGNRSALPDAKTLLVEIFPHRKRYHTVVYSFAGRNANQTLGFLMLRRMKRAGLRPLGFSMTDYALAVWSLTPPEDVESLLDPDIMTEEFEEWLQDTPLLKRLFRDSAIISGLVERRHPGQVKTGRQILFSSDLIYDVLRRHEPDHILLKAVRRDAMQGLIDAGRLADTLQGIAGKIVCRQLDMISPMAVPVIMQIARENTVHSDEGDELLLDMEQDIIRAANVESIH